MKTIRFVITHVMPALFQTLAILLGITAALVSAGVEWAVFHALFAGMNNSVPNSPVFMPLLCVLCLEGTKIYLHIFIPIWKSRGDGIVKTGLAQTVSAVLVCLSIGCTIIWSVNMLYSDIVDTDQASEQTSVLEIEKKYDDQIKALQDNEEAEVEKRLAPYQDAYQSAKEKYEGYSLNVRNSWTVGVTKEEMDRLYNAMNDAHSQLVAARSTISQTVHRENQEKLATFERQRDAEVLARQSQLTTYEGSNAMIHVTLMSVAHYLMQKSSYSMTTYFWMTIGFAVILAIVLELIITIGMKPLTLSESEMERLLPLGSLDEESKGRIQNIIRAFISAAVSLIAYLGFCMFLELGVGAGSVAGALVVFLGSNLLTRYAIPPLTKEKTKNLTGGEKFGRWAATLVAKGSLAFVGYVFLGFLFGTGFSELTLPAVGMTVGSAAGHIVHLPNTNI